jgi:protein O-mannosyl-transferase
LDKTLNRHQLWICIGLAAVTLAVYVQVFGYGFVGFDDRQYIFGNEHVSNGLNWQSVVWALTARDAANWHPLTWLFHIVNCHLFGLNAGFHHLVNVLLHVANTLLLFLLLRRLTGALWKSAFVAALFALHPLHVESVAWIAELKDVLSTLFFLLTLWTYADYVRSPGWKRYLSTLSLFAFGLMAKSMLVSLPVVLLLLDFWPFRRFSPARSRIADGTGSSPQPRDKWHFRSALPLIREKIPFFLLSVATSIVTMQAQKAGGAVGSTIVYTVDLRIANAIHSYVAYLLKAAWPTKLSVFYPYQMGGYPLWEVGLAVLSLLLVTFVVLRFASRFPYWAFGWFWYLATLVPVIGLVQVGRQASADRYTYIPLIGIFLIAAWGAADVSARWAAMRTPLVAAAALFLSACTVTTWFQLHYWRNSYALFTHALEIDKDNYVAHAFVGTDLAERGHYKEALGHYREALRLMPDDVDIMRGVAFCLYHLGKVDQAVEQYTSRLKQDPDDPIALKDLGQVRFDQGRYAEALKLFNRARQKSPRDTTLLCSIGNALAKLGQYQEAIDAYKSALQIQPASEEALSGLAIVSVGQGKASDAIRYFEKVLEIDPNSAQAHCNLGSVYLQQDQVDKARWHYTEALRVKPDYAEAHFNMGVVSDTQQKTAVAIVHYSEAIRIKPDYGDAVYNLAVAQEKQGDAFSALQNYERAIMLKPDFGEAYNNLGVLMYKLGQVKKALDVFSLALQVNPENADARRNRDAIQADLAKSKRNP